MPSGDAGRRRAQRRLRGALLLGARAAARARRGAARALHVARRLRGAPYPALAARGAARRQLPRARRREPARRSRSRIAERRRVLRQEHDDDHAAPRLVGRARHTGDGRGARADAAARHRLRRVPHLHRRLPDRRARRAGRARLDEVPVVLDAGAGGGAGALSRRARGAGLRLRHLPGRLPLEPRRAAAPGRRRGGSRRACRPGSLARGGRSFPRGGVRPPLRSAQRPALAAPERAVALGNTGGEEARDVLESYAAGDDELLGEHARWALERTLSK